MSRSTRLFHEKLQRDQRDRSKILLLAAKLEADDRQQIEAIRRQRVHEWLAGMGRGKKSPKETKK